MKKKNILVAGSMSSGKSSLINALVGQELLPAGNEATTAKIACITIGVQTKPYAKAYCDSGSVVAVSNILCDEQIRSWNQSDGIASFDIVIPHSRSRLNSMLAGYTIIDTPGANNSIDNRHKERFINKLKDHPKSPILYVLNATQLGTTDDAEILRTIQETNPKQPVIFILNKVDTLDEQRGETTKNYVALSQKYLEDIGYKHAKIIPLIAQSALIAKKSLNQVKLRRAELNKLTVELERFRENPFHINSAAAAPYLMKKNVRKRLVKIAKRKIPAMSKEELSIFVDYTGLSIVNALITDAT